MILNCLKSNTNGSDISTYVQIDRVTFASYGTHAMNYFASGTQDAEVPKSLLLYRMDSYHAQPHNSL